jgi:aminopeptidase N
METLSQRLTVFRCCMSDHIALPSRSGAMENWGLITYNEYYLLIDPETSQATGYFDVACVIAHELAHQVQA